MVMAPSVESLILKHLSWYSDGDAPHHESILHDPRDGRLFLNYLHWVLGNFPDFLHYETLDAHRKQLTANLREYESEQSVWEKYEWIATYHNYACTELADRYRVPDPERAICTMLTLHCGPRSYGTILYPFRGHSLHGVLMCNDCGSASPRSSIYAECWADRLTRVHLVC